MKRVLVLGAGGSAAHNFVEALRMSPERFVIVGADSKPYHLGLSGCDAVYLIPRADDPAFASDVSTMCFRQKVSLVHPQPDIAVRALSACREEVAPTFLPSDTAIQVCQDKAATYYALERAGVPVPRSFVVSDRLALEAAAKALLSEGQTMWLRATKGAGSRAALPVADMQEAEMWIRYWQRTHRIGYGSFMLSEYLPGPSFGWASVWNRGKLVASLLRERMEYLFSEFTPSGVSSTPSVARFCRRTRIDESCQRAVLAIDADATGVFCVDLREDESKVPCVTEVNAGRFFTTCNAYAHLARATEKPWVNLPYLYSCLAIDGGLGFRSEPTGGTPEGWLWVRMTDMGYALVREESVGTDILTNLAEGR